MAKTQKKMWPYQLLENAHSRRQCIGHTLKWCMTFVVIIWSSKHFWLLQCIWHLTRVTYPWFITNCSHWNHCIWSQELWEHKFLDLKKVLLFYRSMLRLSFQRSCDHIQWFQWLQVVVHHRYVTLIRCHMHWCSQKCLEVMIISTNVVHRNSMRPLYHSNISSWPTIFKTNKYDVVKVKRW